MCGISGILGFSDDFPVGEELVRRMSDTMIHRGPDGGGALYWPRDRVAFGHRRLSIIDLSQAGSQPMSNEDSSLWISYNGEIYNHAALRAELKSKGHIYRSNTDTETILHLYEEEGPSCVERLEGMFAFAIWDAQRRELFLARDRLGVKPLYYARLPGGLLFSSEAKGLLAHPSLTADIDEEALFHYLTFAFSPAPGTLFQDVHKLAPAERMTIQQDGSTRQDVYWTPFDHQTQVEVATMGEAEMEQRVLDLLRESISKRMMSDVPFGVFLSGGLDSSTNVALMSELSPEPVRTFSTAPKNHPKYNELGSARLVAERFGTDHHEVLLDEADLESFLPELIEMQDEPLSDWTCLPQHFVSRLARENDTPVVQVGEGADELFHGYRGYAQHRRYLVPFQRYVPAPARQATGRLAYEVASRLGRGVRHSEALMDAARSPVPYWGGSICFRGKLKDEVLGPNIANRDSSLQLVEHLWTETDEFEADLFQRMTYVELKQRLAELLLQRLDRIAMLSSVEGREPFLDHKLVELAIALPPRMKDRNGTGKYVLKRAVRDLLPPEIVNRPKQGFGTPMVEWLRGDFGRQAQDTVTGSTLVERGIIEREPVTRLFEAHRAGRGDWSYHLWNLYNLSAWHDRWVAGIPVNG